MAINFIIGDNGHENIDATELGGGANRTHVSGQIDNYTGGNATLEFWQGGVLLYTENIGGSSIAIQDGTFDTMEHLRNGGLANQVANGLYDVRISYGLDTSDYRSVLVDDTFGLTLPAIGYTDSMNEGDASLSGQVNLFAPDNNGAGFFGLQPDGVPDNVTQDWDTWSVSSATFIDGGDPQRGTLDMNADGTYTYTPNDGMDWLSAGQTVTDHFNLTVTDFAGNTQTVPFGVQIVGKNDAPIAVDDPTSTTNLAAESTGQSHLITTNGLGTIGYNTFEVLEDGTVITLTTDGPTMDPNMYLLRADGEVTVDDIIAYDDDSGLPAGAFYNSVITETLDAGRYIVAVSDYRMSNAELVAGINDLSDWVVMTGVVGVQIDSDKDITVFSNLHQTAENSVLTMEVMNNDIDVDTLDVLSINSFDAQATMPDGTLAGAISQVDDKLVFDPGADFDYLAVGESVDVTFEYDITDGMATSNKASVTVTVLGQNDEPVINDDFIRTFQDLRGGNLWEAVLRNDTDADTSDTLTITGAGVSDIVTWNDGGRVHLDSVGQSLRFTPGAEMEMNTGNFYYEATDGHTNPQRAEVHVNVRGPLGDDVDVYSFGDGNNNTITGTDVSDLISGLNGQDRLDGGAGNDLLYGGRGQDVLYGGTGDDVLIGGRGTDDLFGGEGSDLYFIEKGDGRNIINDLDLEHEEDGMGHIVHGTHDRDRIALGSTVNLEDVAIFKDTFGALVVKYSQDQQDKIIVSHQFNDEHYGIEAINYRSTNYDATALPGNPLDPMNVLTRAEIDDITTYISSYDLDGDASNGVQAAQNVNDVQNNEHLMGVIAAAFA